MAERHHHASGSVSAQSRPQSRASTTSATSQRNDESALFITQSQAAEGPEAQLLQYQASAQPQQQSFQDAPPPQQMDNQQAQSAPFPLQQSVSFTQESPYMAQEPTYGNHVRMGSVPVNSGAEMNEDKRRKGSAVTASNDKELREMLSKNEGRPLREVAQEVIQKERTPMAEKTKQLFAMLW